MQSVFLIYAEFLKMSQKNRIRLMMPYPLQTGAVCRADEAQTHYLKNVMRLKKGDRFFAFDGQSGEYECVIDNIGKKELSFTVIKKAFEFEKCPDIWLLFAPLKKENTDMVIQKAVELGASKIIPVKTEYTQHASVKKERYRAQIIEAAEQSRRQDIPTLDDLTGFDDLIKNWNHERRLIYLNESGDGQTFAQLSDKLSAPAAVFIGPEGGFSQKELEILQKLSYSINISLPKRILRAETAAVSALSCWQAFAGDWK